MRGLEREERGREEPILCQVRVLPWAGLVFLAVQPAHTFKMTNYQAMTLSGGNRCNFIPAFLHPSSIHPLLYSISLQWQMSVSALFHYFSFSYLYFVPFWIYRSTESKGDFLKIIIQLLCNFALILPNSKLHSILGCNHSSQDIVSLYLHLQ